MSVQQPSEELIRQFYESRNITGVVLKFNVLSPDHWLLTPFTFGAIRTDQVWNKSFAKFPAWNLAADYHNLMVTQLGQNPELVDVIPMALHEPETYEQFILTLKNAYVQQGIELPNRSVILE